MGSWWTRSLWRWRLVALDGTALEVPDTEANAEYFGRARSDRGAGAFPQVRAALLTECGTHAVFGAALGPFTVSEVALAERLWRRLEPGMLVLADRIFPAFPRWRAAKARGADLLWRVKSNAVLPLCRQLEDGSCLSQIFAAKDYYQCSDPEHVRVIEYTLDGGSEVYRLITTILDPEQAPARELAVLYPRRRSTECCWYTTHYDNSPTWLPGHATSIRTGSPSPAPCTPPAARSPLRRAFPPGRLARTLDRTLAEITRRLLPQRRPRSHPRVARRKMSHWRLKRPEHRHRRHRSSPTPETITITPASRTTSKAKRKLPQGT
ncbi:transposase [Streptomyces flaveolus]|uniref:transposase n=1 Tax=Streptomyces flaveolus TaxID=67297 RepID=UPI003426281C